MRAILVSVDYYDYLAITLPYNRHHFEEVMVVTNTTDSVTKLVAEENDCRIYSTDSFYSDGAVFNKWRALEEALDSYGREGWMCIMDADVLWPKSIPHYQLRVGNLYTPKRRMMLDPSDLPITEDQWKTYPLHRQQQEFAGYTQIFHCDDPHLPDPPWHETDWRHAGGADSFFQDCWPKERKIRPPFEVLHLGESGKNWCGRVVPYLDGYKDPKANERYQTLRDFIHKRRGSGLERFKEERL